MATVSGTSPPLLCCTNRRAGFSNKLSLRSRPQDPILHAKAVFWGIGLPNAAFTTARNPRKELQIEAAHVTRGSPEIHHRRPAGERRLRTAASDCCMAC
ncbi:hypothetical protein ACFX2G_021143 [Malus domestica]